MLPGEQTLSPLFYVLMLVRMMLCLLKLCSGDVIDVLVYLSMICFLNYLEVWTCNRTCYNWWYFREFSCVMVACKKLSNFISKTQKKKIYGCMCCLPECLCPLPLFPGSYSNLKTPNPWLIYVLNLSCKLNWVVFHLKVRLKLYLS
jgi:hypothetical protein